MTLKDRFKQQILSWHIAEANGKHDYTPDEPLNEVELISGPFLERILHGTGVIVPRSFSGGKQQFSHDVCLFAICEDLNAKPDPWKLVTMAEDELDVLYELHPDDEFYSPIPKVKLMVGVSHAG
jgi:hypothetical protein